MKLFGTDGIRGEVGKYPLTKEAVFTIGKALGLWLKEQYPQQKDSLKILIGKDTRESGDELELALSEGARQQGLEVLSIGVCPTPCVAYLTHALHTHLGIAVSASHNPGSDNGIKFFNAKGFKLFSSAEKRMEEIFFGLFPCEIKLDLNSVASREEPDYIPLYLDFAKDSLCNSELSGFTVVMDCAFGSFSKIAPVVFQELGAHVITINNEPNGKNINVNCGTLHPQVMAEKVLQYGANMGIAFDGDGDRLIVADERGNVLDGDHMLAIFAQDLLKQNRLAQNTVVCTQMSNIGLELFLEKLGVHTIRTDVGDKYVLERMLQEKANLGGEQSGHIILLEHTTTGDGLIAALQLIKLMLKEKQGLSEFVKDLEKFPQVLVNVKVRVKRPFDEIAGLSETIERSQAELGRRGRILVRYSGTENLARVMIEGKDLSLVNRLAGSLAKIFEDTVGVK